MLGAYHLGEPRKERLGFASGRLMRRDDRVLALLERVIEVTRDKHIVGDYTGSPERALKLARHVYQRQSRPAAICHLFDLLKAVGSRGIGAGHKSQIEYEEAATRPRRE